MIKGYYKVLSDGQYLCHRCGTTYSLRLDAKNCCDDMKLFSLLRAIEKWQGFVYGKTPATLINNDVTAPPAAGTQGELILTR